MPVIQVENLSKEFSLSAYRSLRIQAIEDVSFAVHSGELLALAGPSGAGKSSILKCIYRTYIPSSGRIWYRFSHGSPIDLAHASNQAILAVRRKDLAYVSQFLHAIPRISARDIVAEPLMAQGATRSEARAEAEFWLGQVGIPKNLWDSSPSTFSGGEQQRINLVRSLIARPRLLLIDEPTASLDAASAETVVGLLRQLKKTGTAICGVFHDVPLMHSIADTVVTITPPR